MTDPLPTVSRSLRSLVSADGLLHLSLVEDAVPTPAADEVLLRVEAAPLNPSDLGLLFAAADPATLQAGGSAAAPTLTASIPDAAMPALALRVDRMMPVGNEGAGRVVAAGGSPAAQALLGKTVAVLGGGMYAEYRCVPAGQCLLLPDGASAADGASAFINPLTALGMVETMRLEGHSALVHTAAASNLGQMLLRICAQDGIALVNIVRRPDQVELLRSLGATHVCDSSAPSFRADLIEALAATGATLAFDATGGGRLAGQILSAMEAALSRQVTDYSRYGTPIHKQVYIYGGLDSRPTEFSRDFGMAWGLGGWLLFSFLQRIGDAATQRLKQRVARELQTTFASHSAGTLSLTEALDPAWIARYGRRLTGEKYLINPNKESA